MPASKDAGTLVWFGQTLGAHLGGRWFNPLETEPAVSGGDSAKLSKR